MKLLIFIFFFLNYANDYFLLVGGNTKS